MLLAAASYFEQEVKAHIMGLVGKHGSGQELIVEFVRNKAVERQFHTYFHWNGRNSNSFFGLFGEGFKSYMIERVRADRVYEQAIQAFLELGNDRNRLVHQDFGTFPLEKTSEELFVLYESARVFVNSLETSFDEYLQSTSEATDTDG